jgi:UDP-glucuronate 4-epimerase
MQILVTGVAGFIGFFVARRLVSMGYQVTGIDNLNTYYQVQLKLDRLAQLRSYENFEFQQLDLADRVAMPALFARGRFSHVIHLAAQAGVRYSLEAPLVYTDSNITGTLNVLEGCRHHPVEHLIYASSSSVYGLNSKMPFSTLDRVDHPVSLYAATKKSNELMAHSYSHLFAIPTTGLRFFTVYGPWGRPDMAPFLFTRAICEGQPIKVFNHGEMMRDFTYIDDIVESIVRLLPRPPKPNPAWDGSDPTSSSAPYKIFNIGNNQPVKLMDFIAAIEQASGKIATKVYLPMQQGDVVATYADVTDLEDYVGFKPATPLKQGITNFVDWYQRYYS